jgi:hypothetical protein
MSVLKLPLLAELKQEVGELVPYIASCSSVSSVLENALN